MLHSTRSVLTVSLRLQAGFPLELFLPSPPAFLASLTEKFYLLSLFMPSDLPFNQVYSNLNSEYLNPPDLESDVTLLPRPRSYWLPPCCTLCCWSHLNSPLDLFSMHSPNPFFFFSILARVSADTLNYPQVIFCCLSMEH